MLQPINARVFVDSEIIENEFNYTRGNKKNDLVTFVFHNVITGKDNRRKNFEYYIHL